MMEVIEWIRFLFGTLFILCGLLIFLIEMIGVFRFKYVLNRMHAAAMGDTLGIACSLIWMIIISVFNFTSLNLLFVIVFLWFSSPTSSHLIARLEVATDEKREAHYSVINLDDTAAEQEQAGRQEHVEEQEQAGEREEALPSVEE